jgi:UDP-N-acetyl-D-galactosamine dehydrogenase
MDNIKICVIGLGYVGLPLARLFSTKFPTVGFDMNQQRVDALMQGHDATREVSDELLQDAISNHGFVCTTDLEQIRHCNFYVVAVPTPVDEDDHPDLRPLKGASETVGKVIAKGDIVVYESTVYPGVTEEVCLPEVERVSGLKFNTDFSHQPEPVTLGDVDGNGIINVTDVTYIINHILGKTDEGFRPEAADMDGNGLINVTDVTHVISKILGK